MSDIVILDSDLQELPDLEAIGLGGLQAIHYSPSRTNLNLGEHERAYYFLSLSAGGMKYQTDLVLNNEGISQWVLLITSPVRTWGLKNTLSGFQASLKIKTVYGLTNEEISSLIDSVPVMHTKKCLIYSKRSAAGKKTTVSFWKKHCRPDWEFETCEGQEEILHSKCSGSPKVIIMGNSLQDFSLQKPDFLEAEPVFLFSQYDRNVQNCIDTEELWGSVRAVLREREWVFPERYDKFYVSSALYEEWSVSSRKPQDFRQMNLVEGFVMWDSYGLPRLREDYTAENIAEFLGQFHALRDIAEKFLV